MKIIITSILGLFAIFTANANQTSTVLTANAKLVPSCKISATNANFGIYDPYAPILYKYSHTQETTSDISIICNKSLPFNIGGMTNTNKPGKGTGMWLKGQQYNEEIIYSVYTGPVNSNGVWFGDGTGGSNIISLQGTGSNQIVKLYYYTFNFSILKYLPRPDIYQANYTLTLSY